MARLYPQMVAIYKHDDHKGIEEYKAMSQDDRWQEHYDYFLRGAVSAGTLQSCVYHATTLAKFDDSAEHKQFCLDLIYKCYMNNEP